MLLLQCVMILPQDSSHIPKHSPEGIAPALLNTIFGKRSSSVPPSSAKQDKRSRSRQLKDGEPKVQHCIRFWIGVNCEEGARSPIKGSKEPLLSPGIGWVPPFFADLAASPRRPPAPARAVSYSSARLGPGQDGAMEEGRVNPGVCLASARKRSASQQSIRLTTNSLEKQRNGYINLEVSDGRCLTILLNILQSSQTQGLLSPQSVTGELDIDDRDEAIQEVIQIREEGLSASSSRFDQSVDPDDLDEGNTRGLHLRLSRSHDASHMSVPNGTDSDDDQARSLVRTPVLKNESDAAVDGRPSRSKEMRHFEHLVKSRAEFPDIQVTPVNAYHYERAHSASPARFARALPHII
ncbi:hypothetical protein NliqN6_1968 [Naganishia liquefaciens]|uniref:Uncharacterized protein n=1 Tax=Naganishia liquefaciens TaxID=104408 RepID=A0A8H3TRD8_9TREE|nr:hypothetical protein NliqN6_1968 [Naganishia liquefaciens]